MHKTPQIKAGPKAFTLIELLVVISIIALLIAVLMPALSSARQAARSTVCKSRQHQVAIAVAVYRADSKNWFPVNRVPAVTSGDSASYPPFGAEEYNFVYQVGPYLNMDEPDDYTVYNGPSKSPLQCPSNGWEGYDGVGGWNKIKQHVMYSGATWGTNYMMASQFGHPYWKLNEPGFGFDYRPKQIDPNQPSRQIQNMEILYGGANFGYRGKGLPQGTNHFWHPGNTTNLTLADGHVASYQMDEQIQNTAWGTEGYRPPDRFTVRWNR